MRPETVADAVEKAASFHTCAAANEQNATVTVGGNDLPYPVFGVTSEEHTRWGVKLKFHLLHPFTAYRPAIPKTEAVLRIKSAPFSPFS